MTNETNICGAARPAVHLLRVYLAARKMGCSCRTVRRWIKQGKLRGRRLGRRAWSVYVMDIEFLRSLKEELC